MYVGVQCHASAALLPRMARHSFYRGLGEPQGRSGRVRKISPHTGIRSPYRSPVPTELTRPTMCYELTRSYVFKIHAYVSMDELHAVNIF
jgi:hypothetical protein